MAWLLTQKRLETWKKKKNLSTTSNRIQQDHGTQTQHTKTNAFALLAMNVMKMEIKNILPLR